MTLKVFTSTVADGSMKANDSDESVARATRIKFLQKNQINPADTTLLRLIYGGDDYLRYGQLSDEDKGDGIVRDSVINNDALVVTKPGHAIMLCLADCIGAVLYNESADILMVSHLGRHSLEQFGGTKSVEYLTEKYNVDPKNLKVWLSPAAGEQNYPMRAFDSRGLHEVAVEQLTKAGVPVENIDVSPVDTTMDENYFSHSQFLKGNQETDGRFAIVAIMH